MVTFSKNHSFMLIALCIMINMHISLQSMEKKDTSTACPTPQKKSALQKNNNKFNLVNNLEMLDAQLEEQDNFFPNGAQIMDRDQFFHDDIMKKYRLVQEAYLQEKAARKTPESSEYAKIQSTCNNKINLGKDQYNGLKFGWL